MHHATRSTFVAIILALGLCAGALADACTVRVVNGTSGGANDCIVAERVEDRSAFPVVAGRAADHQNGVVVTANGAVVLMPVSTGGQPVMQQTRSMLASPRAAAPMHVTLSW